MTDTFWPPVPDFNSMLQNPNVGFKDSELKKCQIQRDGNNQPRPRAGNFAVCYKGTFPATNKDVCIRLFARKSDERRERYAEISAHLQKHPVDCLVKFEYLEDGIRHPNPAKFNNKSWFPIIRMDWIEGSILFDWLRAHCRDNDSLAIANAAEQWIEIASQLESAGIAHCDLQHANVMVTPDGRLKLVDYDCMCVPSLVGRPNLELGVDPYQHPDRNETTKLFPELDRFSELFILVVLKALAAQPDLWFQYIEPPGSEPYDKLLFRRSDFDDPNASAVYRDLKRSPDPDVRKLVTELFKLVGGPIDAIPPLASFVFNFDEVQAFFQHHAWDEGLDLLDRCSAKEIPKEIQTAALHALECVQALQELEQALQSGNERQIQAAYKPQFLDDYPKAQPLVQVAKLAPRVQAVLDQLESARRDHHWKQFVANWDKERSLLSGRISAERYRADVESWRERNKLCDRVQQLSSSSRIDATALAAACGDLRDLGGHPDLDGKMHDIERLVERHTALEKVRKVPSAPGESNDGALDAAWDESLLGGWKDAEQERLRVEAARGRLKKIAGLRQEIKSAESGRSVKSEKAIKALAKEAVPSGYELEAKLKDRLKWNADFISAFEQLEKAYSAKPHSERALARCLEAFTRLKATTLLNPQVCRRLEVALRRRPMLERLEELDLTGPADVVDTAIVTAWEFDLRILGTIRDVETAMAAIRDKSPLKDCADAAKWEPRAIDAVRRAALLHRLNDALDAMDDSTVVEVLDEPLLQDYPFTTALSARIGAAQKKNANVRAMLDALRNNRDGDFGKYFDHRVLKANLPVFAAYEAKIKQVLQTEVLPGARSGLAGPLVGKAIFSESSQSNRYQIKWTWPHPRFTDQCLLGICRGAPHGDDDPNEIAFYRIPINSERWQKGGGVYSLTAKPEWNAKIVAVWAVIDLGFSTVYSEPVILGRVTK